MLFPFTVLSVLISVLTLTYSNSVYQSESIRQTGRQVHNVRRGLEEWFLFRVSEVIQLARHLETEFSGNDQTEPPAPMKEWLSHRSHIYRSLHLIGQDGMAVSTNGFTAKLRSLDFVNYFLRDDLSLRRYFYVGTVDHEPLFWNDLVISAAVDGQGNFPKIIAATIPLSQLKRIQGFSFTDFDAFMIVDPMSRIVVHYDDAFIGLTETEVYGEPFVYTSDLGRSVAFVAMLQNGWKLVCFSHKSRLFSPAISLNRIVMTITFLLIALGAIAIYWIVYRVSTPIVMLHNGVDQIMRGDKNQVLDLHTSDEIEDLSARFNLLQKRLQAIQHEDRFVLLGKVAARMAHELRNPLNMIGLAATALKDNERNQAEYVELTRQQVERAENFIGQMLDIGKATSLTVVEYSITDLIRASMRRLQLITEKEQIALTLEAPAPVPRFFIDPLKMDQVFSNLLLNAIEAIMSMSAGDRVGAYIRVLVSHDEVAHEVCVAVTDSGPGFADDVIDHAFEPYYSTKPGGNGLGLFISCGIVMSHGAQVSLENTPDHHAQVRIVFPI